MVVLLVVVYRRDGALDCGCHVPECVCIHLTSDGGAAYTSEKEGVWHYFHHEDGLGDPPILTIHDPPHAVDLLKGDGQSRYAVDCHRTIQVVFAHFSTSPKRTRQMVRMSKKYEAVSLNPHYLF